MPHLLFVCMGNICRSPTAEGVFRHKLRAAGLEGQVHTDSAGTHDYHVGKAPDQRSLAHALERGVDIGDLRARQVDSFDFEAFDYILAMDEANFDWLHAQAPSIAHPRIQPFLHYASTSNTAWVPDPYFGGEAGFRQVYDLIENAANGLLSEVRQRFSL